MKIKIDKHSLIMLFLGIIAGILFTSCSKKTTEKYKGENQMLSLTIEQVQKKYQDQIMELPGVVGIGIGAVDSQKVIKVLVIKKTKKLDQKIPKSLEGYSVLIEETGEIRAY